MHRTRGNVHVAVHILETCSNRLIHACSMHVSCNMHVFGTFSMHVTCLQHACKIHACNMHVKNMQATYKLHAHYISILTLIGSQYIHKEVHSGKHHIHVALQYQSLINKESLLNVATKKTSIVSCALHHTCWLGLSSLSIDILIPYIS